MIYVTLLKTFIYIIDFFIEKSSLLTSSSYIFYKLAINQTPQFHRTPQFHETCLNQTNKLRIHPQSSPNNVRIPKKNRRSN